MNAAPTEWCNNFWGAGERGYDVVIRRVKDTGQTLDDLRAFYKERADIEAEYAQRLAKLARRPIGQNETGQIAAALETLRQETDRTAQTHATVATDLNGPISEGVVQFQQLQASFRSTGLLAIDKVAKTKANQAAMVDRARDKYQAECTKVNTCSAQLNVVSGRDYERTLAQMDKAKSDVMTHERNYKLYSKALEDTMHNWTKEWKGFLDQAQDMDEARIEFVVQNTWRYIDALAEACVEDDGACQNVYDALKVVNPSDPTFVQERGTGNQVYDPPDVSNFAAGQTATQPYFRVAKFARISQRPQRPLQTDSDPTSTAQGVVQGQPQVKQLHSPSVPHQNQPPYPTDLPDPNFESSPARDGPDHAHRTSFSPAAAPAPLQVVNSPAQVPSSPRSAAGRNPVEDRLAAAMRGVQVSKGSPATSQTQPEYAPPAAQGFAQPSYGLPPSNTYAPPPTQTLQLTPQSQHQPAQTSVHTQSPAFKSPAQPLQTPQPASQPSPAAQYVQDYRRQSRIPSSYALAPTAAHAPTQGVPSPYAPASTPSSAIPPAAATQYLHAQRGETPYASTTASPANEPSTTPSHAPQAPAPSYAPPYAQPNVAPQQVQVPAPVQQAQTYSVPAPAPAPATATESSLTGKLTEEGRPVQFFVKALYAYSATQEGEFSFEEGDIIAVTEYPPDGWWKGELLDEARRRPGQNTFPSNFVQLLV